MNIYDYDDYQVLLNDQVEKNSHTRGYLTELAKAAGCQKSYLTQVLKRAVHFTPEHAMGLSLFWNLTEQEAEYFIQLVHLGRTSFQPLKKKITLRLKALSKESQNLATRYRQKTIGDQGQQALYYSSWLMLAIHIIVDIEKFRTIDAITKYLNVPTQVVRQNLENLEKLGLVKRVGNTWQPTGESIHLPKESSMTVMNHQNWRHRALIDAQNNESDSVHYTSVQTLSSKDFEMIKNNLLKFIDQQRAIIGPSKEEELVCFSCDWFKV